MKTILCLIIASLIHAQESDIFLFHLKIDGDKYTLTHKKNITKREGYDNQPSFSHDGMTLYFASDNEKSSPDIYAYDMKKEEETQLTDTFEKEYSPLMMPDGKHIAFVQQYGRKQNMAKMNLETGVIEKYGDVLNNVGYHCWISMNKVAIFEAVSPAKLHIVDLKSGSKDEIDEYVGRSIHINPLTNKLLFFHYDEEKGIIYELESLDDDEAVKIVDMRPNSHDFIVMTDGTFLSTRGSNLLKFKPGVDKEWLVVFKGNERNMKQLSRIAVNKEMNRIAIVAVPTK